MMPPPASCCCGWSKTKTATTSLPPGRSFLSLMFPLAGRWLETMRCASYPQEASRSLLRRPSAASAAAAASTKIILSSQRDVRGAHYLCVISYRRRRRHTITSARACPRQLSLLERALGCSHDAAAGPAAVVAAADERYFSIISDDDETLPYS